MNKFEYKIINFNAKAYNFNGILEEKLNDLGKDGWECFEVRSSSDKSSSTDCILFLKRALKDNLIDYPVEIKDSNTYTNSTSDHTLSGYSEYLGKLVKEYNTREDH